ncbi:RNL2 Ribonuclease, partial [Sapayoa aenigma]|nr:RNL2 Ribonuclease [Sapayoa aenigma]
MAGWVLCMTLVLAALAGVVVGESRYEKFLRQHVDHPRTPMVAHRYCETMLARR